VLSSRSLIAKVYFPREIVSLSYIFYIFAALADLAIAAALTMAALACTGQSIPATAVRTAADLSDPDYLCGRFVATASHSADQVS
jgi:hypothetical protein